VLSGWFASIAQAQGKVLSGVPDYGAAYPPSADQRPATVGAGGLTVVSLSPQDNKPSMSFNPIGGVPEYVWWYGCSPTAGGMMVGFWDAQPGMGNLYKNGDSQVWSGSGSTGTRRMVASDTHITSGSQNGYTYGDWHNSVSYPNHESNPNCIADFMKTVDSGSYTLDIQAGLEAFCEWDDTSAYDMKDGYQATTKLREVPYYSGTYNYQGFKTEIDAGRPVLLDVITADPNWIGHSIVAYGYQDNMFHIKLPSSGANVTVGGFAVMDTWDNGTGFSEWVGWDDSLVTPIIDINGVEWWPFVEFEGYSWIYDTNPPYGPYDWMIMEGIELTVVPEPATLTLLALGALAMPRRGRKACLRP
jgi:hypothetical protein